MPSQTICYSFTRGAVFLWSLSLAFYLFLRVACEGPDVMLLFLATPCFFINQVTSFHVKQQIFFSYTKFTKAIIIFFATMAGIFKLFLVVP